jgi:hypothetical protein
MYSVRDPATGLNWVEIGKQEPGTPFSKLLDPNAAMIHGLFSQKNLKITIDRKLYFIHEFY